MLLTDLRAHQSNRMCSYIRNLKRGTLNIINYYLQAGLPKPDLSYHGDAVRTTFFKKKQIILSLTPPAGRNVGVNHAEKELLALIGKHQPINAAALANYYPAVTQHTIECWLKQFRDQGPIGFLGAPKTGGYFSLTAHTLHPSNKP